MRERIRIARLYCRTHYYFNVRDSLEIVLYVITGRTQNICKWCGHEHTGRFGRIYGRGEWVCDMCDSDLGRYIRTELRKEVKKDMNEVIKDYLGLSEVEEILDSAQARLNKIGQ